MAAARKFGIDVRWVLEWKKNKEALIGLSLKPKGKEQKNTRRAPKAFNEMVPG